MSVIRFKQKQADPFNELINQDYFWGLPFMPVVGKQLAEAAASGWQPALDVVEDKDVFIIKTDLPGLKKEDIKVSVEDGVLSIEGERRAEAEQQDRTYHKIERSYGRFVRSLSLGSAVDDSKIKANYKDGVLEVIIPKAEKAKTKAIDINVN